MPLQNITNFQEVLGIKIVKLYMNYEPWEALVI